MNVDRLDGGARHRDELRRDRRGAGDGRLRHPVQRRVSTQVDLHAQYGGVVPEIASRAHLDLLKPVIARAIVEAGVEPTSGSMRSHAPSGPGLIGALLVGVSAAKALALDVGRAVRRCQPHGGASVRRASSRTSRWSFRWWCCWSLAVTRCWSRCATTGAIDCSARRSTMPPARHSTRSLASSASGIRVVRRSIRRRCAATRPRSRSPGRCSTTGSTSASVG